jgi:hypothetical protein
MDAKDAALGLGVWQWELNLPVNTARPDEGWVQRLNAVSGHDHLHSTPQHSTAWYTRGLYLVTGRY